MNEFSILNSKSNDWRLEKDKLLDENARFHR
jgi:hypothetical protein